MTLIEASDQRDESRHACTEECKISSIDLLDDFKLNLQRCMGRCRSSLGHSDQA